MCVSKSTRVCHALNTGPLIKVVLPIFPLLAFVFVHLLALFLVMMKAKKPNVPKWSLMPSADLKWERDCVCVCESVSVCVYVCVLRCLGTLRTRQIAFLHMDNSICTVNTNRLQTSAPFVQI